ncbi:unnamed protein product [Phytophthora fragariaefolia]|uniref:Unnamed protein product n=1 Tax=Phytophthora fragariaefolia TaxID=1490495 RepID=A0A9W6XRP6_9STRA|nr:unnamed protein product [Phytophthora fragariaefolia]
MIRARKPICYANNEQSINGAVLNVPPRLLTFSSSTPMLSNTRSSFVKSWRLGNSTLADPYNNPATVTMIAAAIKNTLRRPHLDSDRSDIAPRIGPKKIWMRLGTNRGTKSDMPMDSMYDSRVFVKTVSVANCQHRTHTLKLRSTRLTENRVGSPGHGKYQTGAKRAGFQRPLDVGRVQNVAAFVVAVLGSVPVVANVDRYRFCTSERESH